MLTDNIFVKFLLKPFFTLKENRNRELDNPKKILIIFQHYTLGLLLTQIPLIRAIKEKFPQAKITTILNSQNYYGLTKNKLIDNHFIFRKKKLLNINYFLSLKKILSKQYDVAIVPVTESISITSLLIMRFSNSQNRIGPKSLNGKENEYQFLFDRRIELDWRKTPDSHISDFSLDILRPFRIDTNDYSINISVTETEKIKISDCLKKHQNKIIIGINVGADEPKNRWSAIKFVKLIEKLNNNYVCCFYLIRTQADEEIIKFIKTKLSFEIEEYKYNFLEEIVATLTNSNLVITNAADIMFIAGTTIVPQVSIFGNLNPFNYSPLGNKKHFIRKSDLIDDVNVDDVFNECKNILEKQNE